MFKYGFKMFRVDALKDFEVMDNFLIIFFFVRSCQYYRCLAQTVCVLFNVWSSCEQCEVL